ncbi:helix-turn-helix and ligand-binding sensor domain-containing protein [Flavobacterium caeni]|uniref:Regulatory protein, luxR family n=1 Tax=Flavobacterium caeni TaxID=490189 RepID=A0A1G5B8F2_9FLAO|nr:histidine kinase [Flavobacterium caeni]SCX86465.1 hypothetical protein SAMN02927903_00290 [Flavobacterium caeni]
MKIVAQILFCTVFTLGLRAQELLPFVENFTKTEYQGDNQNWSIAQGADHALYFANNHYLLRYNGVKWEKYTMPNRTIIRAVAAIGDKIYCGSYKEFGYWERKGGKMRYVSLSAGKNLFSGRSANEEIWKIFTNDGRIYFQSFNELFIYDRQRIEKVRFPFQISYCYLVDDDIYVGSVRKGIYLMQAKTFERLQGWSAVDNDIIHHIEKQGGKRYVFTRANGVFVESGNQLVAWNHLLNSRLKSEIILTAKFVGNNKLAIGTAQQGLYLVDLTDQSYRSINRTNAIKNNAVLSVLQDGENDLWLGLDNGIAHVEINSSIGVFTDQSGVLGSVYAMSTTPGGYVFATNHGVFSYSGNSLSAVPASQGQAWDIYAADTGYVIGHNDGTLVYNDGRVSKANGISGGWKLLKSEVEDAFFQAHYSGVSVYRNGDFSNPMPLEGLTKPIRNIAQTKRGELWAADNYRSLYRITYDDRFKTKKVENVSQSNGILNDFSVKLFHYKNEVLFLIDKVWYTYNSIAGKLERDPLFNKSFPDISDILTIDDNHFMILNGGLLYVVSQEGSEFVWELIPEKYYQGKLMPEDSRVFKNGNEIFVNLDDGFLSYMLSRKQGAAPKPVIEGFYNNSLITADTRVAYNQPIDIDVVSGVYGQAQQDFFYTLNGAKEFNRIRNGHLTLNNLGAGEQHLEFYRFDGKIFAKVSDYRFDVKNPWYFSIWMVLVYILAVSGSFFLYYRWNKMRYLQKLQLKEEELRHQQKIRELEIKTENELNIQEYEKHILELELQTKSSEVAGKSLSIAKQGEMIENIRQILESEDDIARLKAEVLKAIKINSINRHEWEVFENNLSQIHQGFISSVTSKYPQLTAKDIKLCIYLKMNLSSKEIAPLMNISFRGVELHRYRLRKKLGLSAEDNLYKFMLSI